MELLRANAPAVMLTALKERYSRFYRNEAMFRCEWKCPFAPSLKSLEPQEVIPMCFSPFVGRDSWVLDVDGCVFMP